MTEIPASEQEYKEMLNALPDEEKEGFERLMGTLKPWEKLHPDLVPWIEEGGPFGACLKHPLVFEMMYSPGVRDGFINDFYEQKSAALDRYTDEGNWSGYVFLHERPYRLNALLEIEKEIEDAATYWKLVGSIWTDSENIWQNYEEWEEILSSDRPQRNSMMNTEEQAFLNKLPDKFIIWRGYNDTIHPDGFSWTLDKSRAEWFARRFASHRGDAYVAMAMVQKSDVIAYFNGRGEEEIVVLPEKLEIIEREEV